ncbi:MAG: glucokinase [Acidobacteriota bacterium]
MRSSACRPVVRPPCRHVEERMLLVGDIGGTKTDLAAFALRDDPRHPVVRTEYQSSGYSSLVAMVREFVGANQLTVNRAVFDVAGPVFGGSAKVTNLPWVLAEVDLARELGLKSVRLLNDLEAIGRAVPALGPDDLHTLHPGSPVARGSIAVVAPGTGLGEAYLTWGERGYHAFPSEGGHADFAPTTDVQTSLLTWLRARWDHVSVERVCSGPGILNIYRFLRDQGSIKEAPELVAQMVSDEDAPRVIGEAAIRQPNPDPLSAAALDLFVAIFGGEAGNLALKVLSTGGVYLAGGIPQRVLPALLDGRFMRAFVAKGRMGDVIRRMPVHVILRRAALIGSARFGMELAAAESDS